MDHITRVRIKNVRAIESVELVLGRPMTVLIGENGAGKSTIVECLELLRKAAEPGFMQQFYTLHRGLPGLLRRGATQLELGVVVEDDTGEQPPLIYGFKLNAAGAGAKVDAEWLLAGPTLKVNASIATKAMITALREEAWTSLLNKKETQLLETQEEQLKDDVHRSLALWTRDQTTFRLFDPKVGYVGHAADLLGDQLLIAGPDGPAVAFGAPRAERLRHPDPRPRRALRRKNARPQDESVSENFPRSVERVQRALRGIEIHVGFDTVASWVARSYQRPESIRAASTLFPAERLELTGRNLANAWNELLAQTTAERDATLALLRLGLGERVDTVVVKPDPGGGNVYLAVRFSDLAEPVYAVDLSDGQLAWLGFVAMARLNRGRSLLAIDEPERHLHPALLGRVVSMLASLPRGASVVLSTHSDRVLELLDDPADAVRVCRLEGGRVTVSRLDPVELPRWLAQFGDLGQLRAAGYLPRVLAPASEDPQ